MLAKAPFSSNIARYSIKYVDFLEVGQDLKKAVSSFNLHVKLGTHELVQESAQIRIEIPRGTFLHAVQVMTGANVARNPKIQKFGALLDVDSFAFPKEMSIAQFLASLDENMDAIHLANKEIFFECISAQALEQLEPKYD